MCRQLHFESAREAIRYAGFGVGSGPIWLNDVNCYGSERDITECMFHGWGNSDCDHREDAGVRCNGE